MKRLLPLLAVAALVAVPAALARHAAVPTLQTGKLIVAFGDAAPGFASGTVRGNTVTNPRGYEVDLASAIAAKLGLTPVWVYTSWNSLFAPGTKKFDISFQEATITAQRKKTVDFTTSYLNANQGVLISKQTTPPKSLADLKKLQTCAQTNTTGLDWITTQLHPTSAAHLPDDDGRLPGGADQPLPGVHPRRPAGRAREEAEPEQVRRGRRPDRHPRAVRRSASEGLEADDDRRRRDEAARRERHIAKLQKKWFNLNFAAIPVLK